MAKETILFQSEELMSRTAAAAFLHQIADRLMTGEMTLQQGENNLTLTLPNTLTLEMKAEEEPKRSGLKKSFEVELEWMEGEAAESVTLA